MKEGHTTKHQAGGGLTPQQQQLLRMLHDSLKRAQEQHSVRETHFVCKRWVELNHVIKDTLEEVWTLRQ